MSFSAAIGIALAGLLAALLGFVVGTLRARLPYVERLARFEAERASAAAQLEAERAGADARLTEARGMQVDLVSRLSQEQQVAALVAPLQQTLAMVERELRSGEHGRAAAQAALREQVESVRQSSNDLRRETSLLTTALRAPQVRGRWGEHQLERIVEVAGMVKHCDFVLQESSITDDGTLRPDLVVRLAGGKQVVVDAKVPFAGFLEAAQATDERVAATRRAAHARHVRAHITRLAAKSYWERFAPSPEFVVMFVPADAFLSAALDEDPGLLEHAFSRNVVIATPSTLVAMLRTIAYAWREQTVTEHAREVLALGRELHGRLITVGGHFAQLGRELSSAVIAYNKAIGSVESRVLVTARRLGELHAADDDLAPLAPISEMPRRLSAPELAGADHELRGPSELVLSDGETAAAFPATKPPARLGHSGGDAA